MHNGTLTRLFTIIVNSQYPITHDKVSLTLKSVAVIAT